MASSKDFELERLRSGDPTVGGHRGLLVAFAVCCDQRARVVLDRVVAIMCLLLEKSQDDWPVNQAWRQMLPSDFMSWFKPELSGDEREQHRQFVEGLSYDERRKLADQWRLSAWLFCMKPEEREWRWAIARCTDDNMIVCVCEFADWPAGWAQLSALFLACGASSVDGGVECKPDLLTSLRAFSDASLDQA